MNDKFTDAERDGTKGKSGCLVVFVILLILAGLLMWFFLWGNATPENPQPVPEVKQAVN